MGWKGVIFPPPFFQTSVTRLGASGFLPGLLDSLTTLFSIASDVFCTVRIFPQPSGVILTGTKIYRNLAVARQSNLSSPCCAVFVSLGPFIPKPGAYSDGTSRRFFRIYYCPS